VADKLNQLNEATGKECRDKGLPAYACSGFFIHAIEGGLGNSQLGLADKGVTIKQVISPLSSPFDVVKNPLKLRLDCSGYIGAGEDLGCFNHTDRIASETEFTALGGNDNTFQTGWNGVEGRGDAQRCPKDLNANFYPAWCQTPKALKVGGTASPSIAGTSPRLKRRERRSPSPIAAQRHQMHRTMHQTDPTGVPMSTAAPLSSPSTQTRCRSAASFSLRG